MQHTQTALTKIHPQWGMSDTDTVTGIEDPIGTSRFFYNRVNLSNYSYLGLTVIYIESCLNLGTWRKVSGQVLASLLLLLLLEDGLHGGHLGDVPLAVLHLLGSLLMLLLASDVLVLRQPLKCLHHLSHSQPQSVQA